jgi:hypothetical protein
VKREAVDFSAAIEPRYQAIHERLENWARTLCSPPTVDCAPMFRLFRADNYEREYGAATRLAVDTHDAHKIDKAVQMLPTDHRIAVQWFYVRPVSPKRTCQAIGCTMQGLDDLVRAARSMLVNRRV